MLRAGQALMLITIALLTVGVIMVNSAGLEVGASRPITLLGVLTGRPAQFALLAGLLLLLGARLPVQRLYEMRGVASPAPWILAGSIALLVLVHVPGIGREVNGAWRWINLGPIGFQPSELAKWGMIIVIAVYAARCGSSMDRLGVGFALPMALVGVICVLVAMEDLGTAVLIGVVATGLLLSAGARIRHIALLVPVGVAGFAAAVIASPYRIDRLRAFLDPYADAQGIGYHVVQSMAAVSGGGLAGRGLGNGLQKFGYLPEDTTDFLFAIIAEELGVAGVLFLLALYGGLLICGWSIVSRVGHPFQRLVGLGVLLTIGCQALINLLVVTGLAPTKGIALPLVSSGGTGWCLTAFFVGLVASMDRGAGERRPTIAPVAAPA